MEKFITKSRKAHQCDLCTRPIAKGQPYKLIQRRWPVFDRFDEYGEPTHQAGIAFTTSRYHQDCTDLPICGNNCEFVPEMIYDGWAGAAVYVPSGNQKCKNCGTVKTPAQ